MIEKYLKQLLQDFDCVTLPGFGGFVTRYQSATVHPIKNTFSPPSKKVAFNSALQEDDGVLLNFIKATERLSEENANLKIQQLISDLKSELNKGVVVSFEDVGLFSLTEECKVKFVPSDNNFLNDSFGLPQLYFKPIEINDKPSIFENRPMEKDKVQQDQNQPEKKKSKLFLILPVIMLIAGGVSLYFLKGNTSGKEHIDEASLILTDSISEVEEIEDVIGDVDEDILGNNLDPDHEGDYDEENIHHDDDHVEYHSEETHRNGQYHIIVSVFSERENSESFISEHTNAEVLEIDGMFKVSIGSFSSLNDASSHIEAYRDEFGEDIWVLNY